MCVMDQSAITNSRTHFRFTLRAMFIAMTMVSAAIWLFIRYAGLPGLAFGVFVICSGVFYLRGRRGVALGFLIMLAVAWVALQFFGPYTSLRNRVVWVVGTERLQQWAVEVLDNPPPTNENGMILLDRSSLPEDIRNVAGHYNQVYLSDDGNEERISLGHGGGFYHWGIIVSRPGYVPYYSNHYDKIADGIWGYRE